MALSHAQQAGTENTLSEVAQITALERDLGSFEVTINETATLFARQERYVNWLTDKLDASLQTENGLAERIASLEANPSPHILDCPGPITCEAHAPVPDDETLWTAFENIKTRLRDYETEKTRQRQAINELIIAYDGFIRDLKEAEDRSRNERALPEHNCEKVVANEKLCGDYCLATAPEPEIVEV